MGMTGYMAEMRRLVGHRTVIQCAASVIVVDQQGRLLLGKRSDDHLWGYSGGSVEVDEVVEECARRELKEEMGLEALELTFFCVNSGPEAHHVYPNGDETSCIDIVYVCGKYHGDMRLQPEEVAQVAWFDRESLQHNLTGSCKQPIRDYFDRLSKKGLTK